MNTTTDTTVELLEVQITELMAEAEQIVKNLVNNADIVPDRIEAMDRVGRLSGAAKKMRKAKQIFTEAKHKHWKAHRILEEANRILSTVSY